MEGARFARRVDCLAEAVAQLARSTRLAEVLELPRGKVQIVPARRLPRDLEGEAGVVGQQQIVERQPVAVGLIGLVIDGRADAFTPTPPGSAPIFKLYSQLVTIDPERSTAPKGGREPVRSRPEERLKELAGRRFAGRVGAIDDVDPARELVKMVAVADSRRPLDLQPVEVKRRLGAHAGSFCRTSSSSNRHASWRR